MRILQICLKPPYPKVDGGCIAMASMAESILMAGHNLKTLCISTHKHPFVPQLVPPDILEKSQMEAVSIDTRIKPFKVLLNLFSSSSYNIDRFHSKSFESRLSQILKSDHYDIIHLESIFCTPYLALIRSLSNAKVVVRSHNVEFTIWKQLYYQEGEPFKKWYLNFLSSRLREYEIDVLNKVDGIISISTEDSVQFQELNIDTPITTIPIGMDVSKIPINQINTETFHLYHLGAMDWGPNSEGISWFIKEVWPKVSQTFPKVKCTIAGRKMSNRLLELSEGNLIVLGEVPSASEFQEDKNIAIVPLLTASGMRVKIIEALALGKVVVSTSVGASGIPYEDGLNLLIADTPFDFVQAIASLSLDAEKMNQISNEARKLAEQEFDLENLSSKLTYFYANL